LGSDLWTKCHQKLALVSQILSLTFEERRIHAETLKVLHSIDEVLNRHAKVDDDRHDDYWPYAIANQA